MTLSYRRDNVFSVSAVTSDEFLTIKPNVEPTLTYSYLKGPVRLAGWRGLVKKASPELLGIINRLNIRRSSILTLELPEKDFHFYISSFIGESIRITAVRNSLVFTISYLEFNSLDLMVRDANHFRRF